MLKKLFFTFTRNPGRMLLSGVVLFFGVVLVFGRQKTCFAQENAVLDDNNLRVVAATNEAQMSIQETVVQIAPTSVPRADLTEKSEQTSGPLEEIIARQKLGSFWVNPLKYAIKGATNYGVPVNTIVLLLLLPSVATLIAAARHLIGLRGFGIFLPASLSVVFIATGPVVGIGLFLVIVTFSTALRVILRRIRIKLQYLPKMALMLLFVVFGVLLVLLSAPIVRNPDLTNVSIFPVLILVLLAEDFSKVQIGKSAKMAINITTETLILALISFIFLTMKMVQEFALLHPELLFFTTLVIDILLGKYVGLRFVEYWRFRKLITG